MSDTPREFADWLNSQVMPGTVISNMEWWAPRIYRKAIKASGLDADLAERDAMLAQAQRLAIERGEALIQANADLAACRAEIEILKGKK